MTRIGHDGGRPASHVQPEGFRTPGGDSPSPYVDRKNHSSEPHYTRYMSHSLYGHSSSKSKIAIITYVKS